MAFGSARQRFLDAAAPVKDDPAPDHIATLLRLAELLGSPKAVASKLAELKAATEDSRKAIIDAGRERAAVAKLRADAESDIGKQRKIHDEKIAAEVAANAKAIAAERTKQQKALADERKAFEAERAALRSKADALRQQLAGAA